MASLNQIERLSNRLGVEQYNNDAAWVKGYTKRDNHLSGALREMSDKYHGEIPLEVLEILSEAAEILDDAHQEWLNVQLAGRDIVGDIDAMRDRDQGTNWFGGFSESQYDDQLVDVSIEWPNLEISATAFVEVLRGGQYKLD